MKNMKSKIISMIFGGLLAGSVAVSAQNTAPVAEPATDNGTSNTNAAATPPGTAAVQTDSAAPSSAAPTVVEDNHKDASNAPAVIPLIVMDDVPLTDAIKNLARQAGLNYMLDPKLSFAQASPDGKMMGQPMVSIRWENITAEQALSALLNNYNLQLVTDQKTKIARVTVKDPAAPDPLVTKIFQLKFASPSNVLAGVQVLLTDKRSRVVADVRTSQLVVLGTEKELDAVDKMIDRLDTQTKQVLIEAKLLETSINPNTIKGIDWRATLQAQHFAAGNNAIGGVLQDPQLLMNASHGSFFSPAMAFLNADGVNAVLSFINQNSEAKVLSEPRTVTMDNSLATLSVTRAVPIINVTAGTANTTGGSQIAYTNLGVILYVTPRISANNYVNLHVQPEVSRVFDTVSKVVGSGTDGGASVFQADEYDIRKIETHVMIPSGHTLVLGGLVQDDLRTGTTKVPVLGDIPGLGYFFRSKTKSLQKNNLLIFVTPSIIGESDYQPTTTDFLKTPIPHHDNANWGPWDSTKPMWGHQTADWSKVDQY
jgi:type II secretory pathway component GspD/PulD (secretin)